MGLILVFVHQDRGLNGIANVKHLIKGADHQNAVARGVKFIVDALDVGFIGRKQSLDLNAVVDISVAGEEDHQQQHNDEQ